MLHQTEEKKGFLAKINTNIYSIVFFSFIIGALLFFNSRDERHSAIEAAIQDDLKEVNGSPQLFDKISSLINGNTLKIRPSWLSFKQIQYRLRNRDFFSNGVSSSGLDLQETSRPEFESGNYYFTMGNRIVKTTSSLSDSAAIMTVPDDMVNHIGFPNSAAQLFRGINVSGRLRGQMRTHPTDSALEVFYDLDLQQRYIKWDTTLSNLYGGNAMTWATSMGCISYNNASPGYVYYNPIAISKNDLTSDNYKTRKIDTRSAFDFINNAYKSGTSFFIEGKKANTKKTVSFNSHSNADTVVPFKNEAFPFLDSWTILIRDSAGHCFVNTGRSKLSAISNPDKIDMRKYEYIEPFYIPSNAPNFFLKCYEPGYGRAYTTTYGFLRVTNVQGDSLVLKQMFSNNTANVLCAFKDVIVLSEGNGAVPYKLSGEKDNPGVPDSILYQFIASGLVSTPEINPDGIMLLPLSKTDFILLRRDSPNKIVASFMPGQSWVMEDTIFDYDVSYDIYYMVIIVCGTIVLYYLGLQLLSQWQMNPEFSPQKLPQSLITTENYKLKLTYLTMDYLRKRSEIMLRLGITFGIFGVAVSALVFQTGNLNLSTEWKDPHTILNVLKPIIILLFMETFTFYFLKQYRIIFNEYKLYYSILLDLLSINSLQELDKIPTNKSTLSLLRAKLVKPPYQMYETDTKEKINEFEHKSIVDVLEKLKEK